VDFLLIFKVLAKFPKNVILSEAKNLLRDWANLAERPFAALRVTNEPAERKGGQGS